jgi:hypothetical protein
MFLLSAVVAQVMHFNGLNHIWPNIPNICNSFVVSTFIGLLVIRFINKLIRNTNDCVQRLFKTTLAFYKQEEQISEHRPVLLLNLKFLDSLVSYFFFVSLVGINVPALTAWILSWYTGELILPAPVFLPYTDPKTLFWYIVNSALLASFEMLLFVLFMTTDVLYIFFIYQSVPMVDIYCMKLRRFGEKLVKVKTQKIAEQVEPSTSKKLVQNFRSKLTLEHEKAKKIETVERQLIAFIKEFNTYNEYVKLILFFMEYPTFASMSLNSVSIGMAIVVMLYYSKAIGGVMIIFLFSLVFTPCVQGTVISHQKKKLVDEICAFPWYELSKTNQKLFLQLIHLTQNSTELTVPIVGQMNMERFTDVMSGGFSYFSYLYNFVGDL